MVELVNTPDFDSGYCAFKSRIPSWGGMLLSSSPLGRKALTKGASNAPVGLSGYLIPRELLSRLTLADTRENMQVRAVVRDLQSENDSVCNNIAVRVAPLLIAE